MTQIEYDKLMNALARAIHTQRRFIELLRSAPLSDSKTAYFVKLRGFYRYRIILRDYELVEVARSI